MTLSCVICGEPVYCGVNCLVSPPVCASCCSKLCEGLVPFEEVEGIPVTTNEQRVCVPGRSIIKWVKDDKAADFIRSNIRFIKI